MTKVKLEVLRPWISQKLTQMMKLEDDVVENYVINQLEQDKYPDPKKIQ
jgi:serine/arginine repetitive matrix protein 1